MDNTRPTTSPTPATTNGAHCPDVEGSKLFRSVGQYPPDYMAQHPTRKQNVCFHYNEADIRTAVVALTGHYPTGHTPKSNVLYNRPAELYRPEKVNYRP